MSPLTWTAEQEAIFKWFAEGEGNLAVVARAGTAKTTTCLEGISRDRRARSILVTAHNRGIADTLKSRLRNSAAKAMTLNAVGNRFVHRAWRGVEVEQREQRGQRARYLSTLAAPDAPDTIIRMISRLHTFGRELKPFATSAAELLDIAWDKECVPAAEWAEQGWDDIAVCKAAFRAMEEAKNYTPLIDFADQIFLPLANGWVTPTYDLTVVDEYQDMSPGQIELALRASSGRVAVIGDDRQTIYGFRGADSQAMARLVYRLNAKVLRLTASFRCGRAIVAVAQQIVPDIVAAPTTGEGLVRRLPVVKMLDQVKPGDVILSRVNAPLIGYCLHLLRASMPARVEGKDLATGIRTLIRELASGMARTSVDALLVKLADWEKRETDRALATASADAGESRVEFIAERAEAIRVLAQGADEVSDLQTRLEQVFSGMVDDDGRDCVLLSSIHKAKGKEWDVVFLLEDTLREGPEEELNLRYVGVTRARRELVMVYDPGAKTEERRPRASTGRLLPQEPRWTADVPRGEMAALELERAEYAAALPDDDDEDPFAPFN